MSHEHACIEDRIAALEAKVAELAKAKSRIVLKSPCGTRSVTIDADAGEGVAGVWVKGHDTTACMYAEGRQGAVVGVWGKPDKDGHYRSGLDACLSSNPGDGGTIQLITPKDEIHFMTAAQAGKGYHADPPLMV